MVTGTGIKIKTIESFSYGVPLLSTEFGITGTGSTFEFHNFYNLEEIVNHLDNLYSAQASLQASKYCFHSYSSSFDSQLNSLLDHLEKQNFDEGSSPELMIGAGQPRTALKKEQSIP